MHDTDLADDFDDEPELTRNPDRKIDPFRLLGLAIGWGIAAAVAGGAAALGETWVFDHFVTSLGHCEPLPVGKVVEIAGLCAVVGLITGTLGGVLLERSFALETVAVWGVGSATVAAIGGALSGVLIRESRSDVPAQNCMIIAWAVAGLVAGVAGFCRSRMSVSEFKEEEEFEDQPVGSFRLVLTALGWGMAGAIVSGLIRALVVVAMPKFGLHVSPLGTSDPLTAAMVFEVIGWCALAGLLMGVLGGVFLEGGRRVEGGVLWGLGGTATGAIGGGLTVGFAEWARGSIPDGLATILAWAVAGLFAGILGFCRSRAVGPRPALRSDDTDIEAARAERPRVVWIHGTPAGRLVPVFGVAVGCIVLATVTPPSSAGWAVVAIGLLGLAVGCALVGQERKIAALEQRLRQIVKQG